MSGGVIIKQIFTRLLTLVAATRHIFLVNICFIIFVLCLEVLQKLILRFITEQFFLIYVFTGPSISFTLLVPQRGILLVKVKYLGNF